MKNFIHPIQIHAGQHRGKRAFVIGPLANLHPDVTRVYVWFPDGPAYKKLKSVARKNLSELSEAQQVLL